MTGSGFILIHRQIIDWDWYSDTNTKALFIHCLLMANWEEKTWRGKTIKRGQFFTSIGSLSAALGISGKAIRISLDKLKRTNEVAIEGANDGTMVTVCKYEQYQEIENQKGKRKGKQQGEQRASEGQTEGQQLKKDNTLQQLKEVNIHPLQKLINEKYKTVGQMKSQPTYENLEELNSLFGAAKVEDIFKAMENKAELTKKYSSVYLTALAWLKREIKQQHPSEMKVDYKFTPLSKVS